MKATQTLTPARSLEVTRAKSLQSCPTLCNPTDCSPPGPSVHGILQARILEWVAMPFSRGSSPPRDQTRVSSISCFGSFTTSATQFPQLFFPPTSLHSLFKAQGDWITDYICLLKEWSAWKNVFLPLKIFLLLSSRYFQKELESIWVQPSMLSIYSGHSAVVLFRYLNK